MSNANKSTTSTLSRRNFLQTTAVAGAAAITTLRAPLVHAAGSDDFQVKIGLVGCGGRGTGALMDCIGAATKVIYPKTTYHTENVAEGATALNKNVHVVALADLFDNRMEN